MPKVDTTSGGRPVVHGRASSYNNHGCRCSECTTAWAEYMRPRIKASRAKKRLENKKNVQINL